ncbi:MAG: isoprenylcysteine carboxylmethyltransferase family protein [Dehalococcoidia bacterium]|nr:isoprenylcysteine carboxylmethyltransferase family protein [Dehalococcoidia bacterium]
MSNKLKSFILPVIVLLAVPGLILWLTGFRIGWGLPMPWEAVVVMVGAVMIGNSLYYMVACIRIFMYLGKGTLAPWAPPEKLVVFGFYRHMRNPMIGSVLLVLLGESIAFGSPVIFIWFALFFGVNHVYFMVSEEPGLEKRFGEEYRIYKRNVPRWIPRLKPWDGTDREPGAGTTA